MKEKYIVVNYAKIETEIIKHSSEYRACDYTYEDRKYKVFTDGFIAYFIPESSCHLDIEKFKKQELEQFITKILNEPCETAQLSDIYRKDRTEITRKLVSASKTVYVKDKLIRPFAKCGFEIIDPLKPIIARLHNCLIVGIIMPLRVIGNEAF